MKTFITTIMTALLLASSLHSFATTKNNPLKEMNSTNIIKTYMEATALGNTAFNEHLFAKDFQYQTAANPNTKFNKKQYSTFLKATKGLQYDCKTSYDILDESKDCCVAKATMQFPNFTRVDYITLCRSQDSWQVSKVVTTYP
ncbi:nuclear transport factor 2 family protein [Sphingobacterium sp. SYP-B4668]|uniref:nuclear transport factor 2 family protein n=1 Tax=Sphingobacterium sp. SYP-B4668 TaxID=2996035 RepID=UPI0022DE8F24|nr:nuclear transport factor 2 family protein [Sphingobacterium sp. SYP-B4668]